MLPENSCVSCVTKPICARSASRSISVRRCAVVEDLSRARVIQADQQLHERRFAGAGRPDEGDRLAALDAERDVADRRRRGRLVLERDALEVQRPQIVQRHRPGRPRLLGDAENLLIDVQRRLGLAVDVDDVAQLLQRPEDEERVDEQREELPDGDRSRVNQIEHQEHDAGAQEVHRRSLDEAQAAQVADLLQLELQNLAGGAVQPRDLLLSEPETLHQLDVAQRLGGRPGQRRGFGDDHLLNLLDAPAEHRAEDAENRHRQEVDRRDHPVHAERVAMTKMMPTSDVNRTLIAVEISFSTSVRTFCRRPSVSPLR